MGRVFRTFLFVPLAVPRAELAASLTLGPVQIRDVQVVGLVRVSVPLQQRSQGVVRFESEDLEGRSQLREDLPGLHHQALRGARSGTAQPRESGRRGAQTVGRGREQVDFGDALGIVPGEPH